MNPLLEQFLSEAREALQGISEKLMQLEQDPSSSSLITELFRIVHTLKGNSGLFDFPELTRVLHAGEDLMDAVREGQVVFSLKIADLLLDAMDFLGALCDEIERDGSYDPARAADSVPLAQALRRVLEEAQAAQDVPACAAPTAEGAARPLPLPELPEAARDRALEAARNGQVHLVLYTPAEECFFQGDDPFFVARQTPGLIWGGVEAREPFPTLAELDPYRCVLDFRALSDAPLDELAAHYRYVTDQVRIVPLSAAELGESHNFMGVPPGPGPGDDQTAAGAGETALPQQVRDAAAVILAAQQEIFSLPDDVAWISGRLRGAAASLKGCLQATGEGGALPGLAEATEAAVARLSAAPLQRWLEAHLAPRTGSDNRAATAPPPAAGCSAVAAPESEIKFGRRSEDNATTVKSIKVDQEKIDRLMNLIGEMVVAKNALPYLAGRAEAVFGVRELSREIKAQYAVINRIAEEMQDAIMQVRMMPVSFVFQRFPRLVRDTSNKLGKKVNLVLEGEETEADKNIIEALGDPLVHIVRNSLDHGIESPEARVAAGKPATGTLTIRATQEADRAVIEIRDDGNGIDPAVVKRKAYEKGLIDETQLERLTDQEAVNLVFIPGFSTAKEVSDLSGRGVGMDVVRSAIERVNGTVHLQSEKGKGTRIRISLPLSMAVTNVMIVESNGQIFGVPMEAVVETVRVPQAEIRTIKRSMATVLRGRLVPLKHLNTLLALGAPQRVNDEGEHAVLVVNTGEGALGIVVDDFHETVDIILKPMAGILSGLSAYAGSALLGDGSVLMVLDLKEVV